jgi:hypothetical protein
VSFSFWMSILRNWLARVLQQILIWLSVFVQISLVYVSVAVRHMCENYSANLIRKSRK